MQEGFPLPQPKFVLFDPGSPDVIDYQKYGEMKNVGTTRFQYVIKDRENLKKAVGAGIYPNNDGVWGDPLYQKMLDRRVLDGSPWDFLNCEWAGHESVE